MGVSEKVYLTSWPEGHRFSKWAKSGKAIVFN